MDSTALAYQMREQFDELICLSINYAQRHVKELDYAHRTAAALEAEWLVVNIPGWGALADSVLTQEGDAIPHGHYAEESMIKTVVPFRNPIMLGIAMSIASSRKADAIAIAVHAGDHFVYPDCRPDFITAFREMSVKALEGLHHPRLLAPFLYISKTDIVEVGERFKVPWHQTWSCYEGESIHCGRCGTCTERLEAFAEAGVKDLGTPYTDTEYWKTVTT